MTAHRIAVRVRWCHSEVDREKTNAVDSSPCIFRLPVFLRIPDRKFMRALVGILESINGLIIWFDDTGRYYFLWRGGRRGG